MGDRLGNVRWWDVTNGQSSSFNTHREGIRRIKFSPVVPGDRSLGRIAVLFNDNTYSVFDLVSEKSSIFCFFSYLVFVNYVATYFRYIIKHSKLELKSKLSLDISAIKKLFILG